MKKLCLTLVLLVALKGYAQTFEGTIKWSMTLDITDPKKKAQMEEAQKKMNDPANQAKMKEMQAKMNDPQFKAMMESNPQMKAQMERMMGAMQGGSLLPSGWTMKIKNQNTVSKMDGGMMDGTEFLFLADKGQSYVLDRANKTFSVVQEPGASSTPTEANTKVTKTSETATILGHVCTKYIIETTVNNKPLTQNVWATKDINVDMKAWAKQRMGKHGDHFYFDKIDGVPLKMEMKSPEGTMIMEATSIKKESLNSADFVIPSDFKEVPMMMGR